MDRQEKVELLGMAATYDVCAGPCASPADSRHDKLARYIAHAVMAGGQCVRLLKVLLTNVCENDCAYCGIRASRDTPRTAFTPDELARCFDEMHRAGLVDGLFLSSGVCTNAVREMDRMLATVELVRRRYQFDGYIHLKILPGATADQIERAAHLANRISANLEAPNAERLARLSTRKQFDSQLLPALRVAARLVRESGRRLAPAGVTTQFVVGAAEESDREILDTVSRLYGELGLARAYYSAFTPIPHTPLEDRAPTPPVREYRLYQSDFLLRRYGFRLDELVFDGQGNLPAGHDPKVAWAKAHPELFPVEVNRASREMLLRVPGIGPTLAERIVRERRRGKLTELAHLRELGVCVERAAPYVLLDGRRPAYQLSLWSEPT